MNYVYHEVGIFSQPLRSVHAHVFISVWQVLTWMHKWTCIPCGKIINWAMVSTFVVTTRSCVHNWKWWWLWMCSLPKLGLWIPNTQILLSDTSPPVCIKKQNVYLQLNWSTSVYIYPPIYHHLSTDHLLLINVFICECMYHDKRYIISLQMFLFIRNLQKQTGIQFCFVSPVLPFCIKSSVGSGKSHYILLLILTFRYV